jgi:hypothetical protein
VSESEYRKEPCLTEEKSLNTEDVKVKRPAILFMKNTPPRSVVEEEVNKDTLSIVKEDIYLEST